MWVSSHVGIPVNEKVDAMVDEAITSGSSSYITKIITKDPIIIILFANISLIIVQYFQINTKTSVLEMQKF